MRSNSIYRIRCLTDVVNFVCFYSLFDPFREVRVVITDWRADCGRIIYPCILSIFQGFLNFLAIVVFYFPL
ncbi:hypothetical protein DU484_00545 (plasmid) [Haloplanus rubicundus]|uniref:Uncharacterized protein n=1 Tax=Haloplanus rubicundus TaxID=1547898 RepID=A0A345E8D2_9EURY|nr:hypothetical protein DU484_00545 [Haloplanus rubicundus]